MRKAKTSPATGASNERVPVPESTRHFVLLEAGYKCANPVCRNMLTLQVHHIEWVKAGGNNRPENLIALCGYCHDLHTFGKIPEASIRVWKALLVSLNTPERNSVDVLLHLRRLGKDDHASLRAVYNAGDLLPLAPLLNAGLLKASMKAAGSGAPGTPPYCVFEVTITDRGNLLIEAWENGDEKQLEQVINSPRVTDS